MGKYTREERKKYTTYYNNLKKYIESSLNHRIVAEYNQKANDKRAYIKYLAKIMGEYKRHGFDFDYTPTSKHDTLLIYALEYAKKHRQISDAFEVMICFLINNSCCNASVDKTNSEGLSALMLAVAHNWHFEIVPQIIAKSDVNYTIDGMTVLDCAIISSFYMEDLDNAYGPKFPGIVNRNIPLLLEAGARTDLTRLFETIKQSKYWSVLAEQWTNITMYIENYWEKQRQMSDMTPKNIYEYEI